MTTTATYNATTDDCWGQYEPDPPYTGSFEDTVNVLYIAHGAGYGIAKTWIPFTVTLPAGIVITTATIKWYASQSRADSIAVKIGCEDADNPSKPATWAALNGRVMTTAFLAASISDYTAGNQYSYTITSAVQEVLSRAGWASGNTLAVLIHNNGTSDDLRQQFAAYEHATYAQASLEIVYEPFIPRFSGLI